MNMSQGNERTLRAKKNIIYSLFIKGINIGTSLLVVPITINYLNPTKYGIWLTLSSILGWIAFFDMGFTHGFRNKFAEALAKGDRLLAKSYVSTTYCALAILFSIVLLISLIVNHFLNWSSILSVESSLRPELTAVFNILLIFFCLQMVLKVITTMILADQRNALASAIETIGQVFSLVVIYILTKTTTGSLINLATAISFVPSAVLFISSIIFFNGRYKPYRPSFSFVKLQNAKNIVGLGGKFFIIQISSIFVFQCINIIISHLEGPENVTRFNIAYKYFSIFNMLMSIFITPFWSAFTDAFSKEDYNWMIFIYKKLRRMWYLLAAGLIVALFLAPPIIGIWIDDKVDIPFMILLEMAVYILMTTNAGISVTLLNGIGKVTIQMYIHLFFSIISIPMLILSIKYLGLEGGLFFLCLNPLTHLIFSRHQLSLILNRKAYGIWIK